MDQPSISRVIETLSQAYWLPGGYTDKQLLAYWNAHLERERGVASLRTNLDGNGNWMDAKADIAFYRQKRGELKAAVRAGNYSRAFELLDCLELTLRSIEMQHDQLEASPTIIVGAFYGLEQALDTDGPTSANPPTVKNNDALTGYLTRFDAEKRLSILQARRKKVEALCEQSGIGRRTIQAVDTYTDPAYQHFLDSTLGTSYGLNNSEFSPDRLRNFWDIHKERIRLVEERAIPNGEHSAFDTSILQGVEMYGQKRVELANAWNSEQYDRALYLCDYLELLLRFLEKAGNPNILMPRQLGDGTKVDDLVKNLHVGTKLEWLAGTRDAVLKSKQDPVSFFEARFRKAVDEENFELVVALKKRIAELKDAHLSQRL